MEQNLQIKYSGQRLIERGFKDWFLFFFKTCEGKDFIVEGIQDDIFKSFNDLYISLILRLNINIPPRSGKTTICKYFLAYCWAINPKCNFIYTSYSQDLLRDISRSLADVLENPIYKAMYNLNITEEEKEEKPIDNFWTEYLKKTTGKNSYSSKKIVSGAGGVILFASVGSSITGFGAGIRTYDGFSGALIMDDLNKPADMKSEVMRLKAINYYDETLLSRLNDYSVPIINIQQRLHIQDISGYIMDNYDYTTLKKPLLENGVCQLPSQYDETRLHEIQKNEYMFLSQYQQEPIQDGGNIFKWDWFDIVDEIPEIKDFEKIFFTVDSAFKDKKENDLSVVSVFGILKKKLYLIYVMREKSNSIDLPEKIEKVVSMFADGNCDYTWIEDKASGITLNQGFRKYSKIVKVPKEDDLKEYLKRIVGKEERAKDCCTWINDVEKNILIYSGISCYNEIKAEIVGFPESRYKDFIDTFVDGINLFGKYYTKKKVDYVQMLKNRQMMGF